MKWIRNRLCKWLGIWDLEYRQVAHQETLRLQSEWVHKLQTKVHVLEESNKKKAEG